MKLLGFNLTKIMIEKISDKRDSIKINTNIDVSEINQVKSSFLKIKEEVLGVKFSYVLDYSPDFAKIEFKGNLVLSVPIKQGKEILKEWEQKKIPEDFRIPLFNLILRKCNIKALQLEEELNIPIHIQLPVIKMPEKK